MSHARHAKPRAVNARGRAGTALIGIVALVASLLVATSPAPSTASTDRVRNPINYGSGLFTPPTTAVKRIGDPATADALMVGDSLTNGCSSDLIAAFAAKGKTLAIIAQSGQNAAGLYPLLAAVPDPPERTLFAAGTNDVFNPAGIRPVVADVELWAATAAATGTTTYLMDTYVARPTTATHDQRNSAQVNGYLYGSGLPVISTVEPLTAAVGRGRALNYYLRDAVHYWEDAATSPYTHGDGCAFLAATVVAGIGW
jgi:hypothetical protein